MPLGGRSPADSIPAMRGLRGCGWSLQESVLGIVEATLEPTTRTCGCASGHPAGDRAASVKVRLEEQGSLHAPLTSPGTMLAPPGTGSAVPLHERPISGREVDERSTSPLRVWRDFEGKPPLPKQNVAGSNLPCPLPLSCSTRHDICACGLPDCRVESPKPSATTLRRHVLERGAGCGAIVAIAEPFTDETPQCRSDFRTLR